MFQPSGGITGDHFENSVMPPPLWAQILTFLSNKSPPALVIFEP